MSKYLMNKLFVILVLVVVLLFSVMMITSTIKERQAYQEQVIHEVSKSTSKAQTLVGPILVVPYKTVGMRTDTESGEVVRAVEERYYYILPEALNIKGKADVAPRKLGIYQAQVYAAKLNVSGSFGVADFEALRKKGDTVYFGDPYLVVSLSDTRGILNTPELLWNNNKVAFKEGVVMASFGSGIHAPMNIDALLDEGRAVSFSFDLDVQGTQSFSVVPIGRASEMKMESNWSHPNFLGDVLPQTHSINEQGFSAQWKSTWFANNINDRFGDHKAPDLRSTANCLPVFSVSMIETVDQYQLNERTVKYAILFIGLTFIGFLAFELISRLRIHPVQYALVGFALVMFYLLLLALSEHIGFNLAYMLAAMGSSGLIGLYLCSVLKGVMRGAGFAAGLLALYGLLYLILQSEDKALLFGSSLLFIILAVIMLLTRKLDWYQLSDAIEAGVNKRSHGKGQVQSQEVDDE